MKKIITLFFLSLVVSGWAQPEMNNGRIKIKWSKTKQGWTISDLSVNDNGRWCRWGNPSGLYTVLYAKEKPDEEPLHILNQEGDTIQAPEPEFKYIVKTFARSVSSVPMNRAGESFTFYPDKYEKKNDQLVFEKKLKIGEVKTIWSFDDHNKNDILVEMEFTAATDGYFSLSSVSAATIENDSLQWGIVPGYFQGKGINPSFLHSYGYAQGLPAYPVLCRESTITSPTSILTDDHNHSLALVIEPGQESPRVSEEKSVHDKIWKIALSHMNRDGQLSPTGYHPVLGEEGSYLKKGDKLTFRFRYSLQPTGWYDTYKHVVNNIYEFDNSLKLKATKESLSDRVLAMHDYLTDNKTSHWNVEKYNDMEIGAQSYMGGVAGSDNDAMKNSDIGAVWMLSELMQDQVLQETRLPFIRNFKIAQQADNGFFEGAAKGQYYLAKKQEFVEEWGQHYEPIGLTYYTLCDIGNILLFEPDDTELLDKLQKGADRLLTWQNQDGSWPVAFDRNTHQPIFSDLKDYRPTFYGLYIAYQILKDEKYLQAAIKGADWYVENAVKNGYFIGVCGDVRFVNDFATAQSVQALLDMYDSTNKQSYKDAAIEVARMYTTSIYSYPIPTKNIVKVKGVDWEDWQLAQSGLGFEHGGIMGSAVLSGPILLAGHTGLFVRLAELTGDSFFLDMARAGALGRDAFINPNSHVASYYWTRFNEGPGQFPHHGWWQVGWIMDYLVAEAELRSEKDIQFGRGFVTPKVGPHQTRGFDLGVVNNEKARLRLYPDVLKIDNPNIDYLMAEAVDSDNKYIILMNQQANENSINLSMDQSRWGIDNPEIISVYDEKIINDNQVRIEPFGIALLKISGTKK